jgi:hypothetical protein
MARPDPYPPPSQVWLDVISAVDYLSRGHRHGLTVYDALEEAMRWHTATLVAGDDDRLAATVAAELPWDDPDPLRSALERLVLHLPSAVDEHTTTGHAIHAALAHWVQTMAAQYNDGHRWTHPRASTQPIPAALMLPFADDVDE